MIIGCIAHRRWNPRGMKIQGTSTEALGCGQIVHKAILRLFISFHFNSPSSSSSSRKLSAILQLLHRSLRQELPDGLVHEDIHIETWIECAQALCSHSSCSLATEGLSLQTALWTAARNLPQRYLVVLVLLLCCVDYLWASNPFRAEENRNFKFRSVICHAYDITFWKSSLTSECRAHFVMISAGQSIFKNGNPTVMIWQKGIHGLQSGWIEQRYVEEELTLYTAQQWSR